MLALRQAQEIELLKSKQTRLLQDRKARRKTKQFQRGLTKEDKTKDLKLRDQEESNEAVQCIQEMVRQTDLRLQAYLKHTESRHEKQNKQLGSLQDRRAMDRRILVDLECCHLNDAEKSGIMKEFNVKKSHQKTIDKKVYDHQDEIQQQEVRHLKESNDAELQMIVREREKFGMGNNVK